MTWARRRSDLPPDQLEDAVAALTADEAPEMDQMLAEYAAGSAAAAWEFDQGMFAFGKPSPRTGLAETLKCHLRDGIAEAISCPPSIDRGSWRNEAAATGGAST